MSDTQPGSAPADVPSESPAESPTESPAQSPTGSPAPGAGMPPADVTDPALAQVRAQAAGTLIERLGIEVTEVGPDRVVATMPVEGNTQPYGLLHGGASAALAETLGSFAAALHAGPDRAAVGLELNATHHRAVRSGRVRGVARALHLGRSTASYGIEVTDERGALVCSARLTCMLLAGVPAP